MDHPIRITQTKRRTSGKNKTYNITERRIIRRHKQKKNEKEDEEKSESEHKDKTRTKMYDLKP